jgi:hypothetical protein
MSAAFPQKSGWLSKGLGNKRRRPDRHSRAFQAFVR